LRRKGVNISERTQRKSYRVKGEKKGKERGAPEGIRRRRASTNLRRGDSAAWLSKDTKNKNLTVGGKVLDQEAGIGRPVAAAGPNKGKYPRLEV